jgi:hypothetical protein
MVSSHGILAARKMHEIFNIPNCQSFDDDFHFLAGQIGFEFEVILNCGTTLSDSPQQISFKNSITIPKQSKIDFNFP